MSMLVLGMETATALGSVAIVDEEEVVAEYALKVRGTHSERLLPAIDALLKDSKLSFSDLNVIAVSIGPGSFTGLRIGISTAKGLALGSNKPVVGIPTLDALADHYPGLDVLICPMLDAKKNEVFAALYRRDSVHGLQKLTKDLAISPHTLLRSIGETAVFLGDGSQLYRRLIQELLGGNALFPPLSLRHPRAATIAFMGMEQMKRGNTIDVERLVPVYVRASDAELNRRPGERTGSQ